MYISMVQIKHKWEINDRFSHRRADAAELASSNSPASMFSVSIDRNVAYFTASVRCTDSSVYKYSSCQYDWWLTTRYRTHSVTCYLSPNRGTAAAAPPPFRLGNPALCASHPLVTPWYYCRLGNFLCFCTCVTVCLLFCCILCCLLFWVFFTIVAFFPSVLWYCWCWLGLLTRKTVSEITYDTVLVETLNPAHSLTNLSPSW